MPPPPTWQFAVAAYTPLFTGSLSVIGSSLIIYSMVGPGRKTKLKDPQHRLLLAMSIYDVIYSFGRGYSFLFVPDGFGVPGAQGNLATCSLQGFIIQLGHAIGAYNALLAGYYWLTICHGMKADKFAKYESFFHVIIFLIFVGLGITGVAIGLYNPSFGFCFIASWPWGCESGPNSPQCERFPPAVRGLMNEIFSGMWFQTFTVIIMLANTAIWWKVRKQEQAVSKYRHEVSSKKQFSSISGATAVSREDNFADEYKSNDDDKSTDAADTTTGSKTTTHEKKSLAAKMSASSSQRRKKASKERMVLIQSTLFVLSFLSCYLGPQIFFLVDWLVGYRQFWPVVIVVIFTPLQGFWNAFIYARPMHNRIKRNNPNMSRWMIFKLIFFVPDSS